ncbi:double-strand-break repair protein rad21 homolog isoform X2 [Dendronephthya gigantea]|uniref:double-strand-break repair protein rad21 homolog isoform X2 n=1 Tax=Dendronephthya gigantea TaxID=151771 RepID=UPI00106A2D1E|nr:double-strand-break repair protein rad21 homolog isoform X2 [Dendronephthya gigantea]
MSSFHYDFILSKRSSLAKVWLAAHWEKKLSKVQIFETNLQSIVQDILHPKMPIALRTSSHLLVGLVRIYSRKAKYLLKDCSDTLVNIKVTFRPGASSLDKAVKQRKSVSDIMDCPLFITEKVDLLDQWIPEVSNVELDCTLNQSKVEEITLQEEPMKVSSLEDYFDDEGFGDMDADGTDLTDRTLTSCSSVMERVSSLADSAYGTEDTLLGETTSQADFYSDPFSSTLTPVKDVSSSPSKETTGPMPKLLLDIDDEFHTGQNSEDIHVLQLDLVSHDGEKENNHRPSFSEEGESQGERDEVFLSPTSNFSDGNILKRSFEGNTGLDEHLILDPIENTQKVPSSRKRHKRKLVIDEVISIEREVIFNNINNPSQLVTSPVFGPKTKRRLKELDRSHSLQANGSVLELSPALDKLFVMNSSCRKFSTSNVGTDGTDCSKPASEPCESLNENDIKQKKDLLGETSNHDDEDAVKSDEHDIFSQFIPLQDVDYSSDEDSPRPGDDNFQCGLVFDQIAEENTVENMDQALEDENISEDKFCSHVEATVLESQPEPVELRHAVGSDGKKLTRKTVARRFLKCLLMQRDARLSLEQDVSFGEILLHPGSKHST